MNPSIDDSMIQRSIQRAFDDSTIRRALDDSTAKLLLLLIEIFAVVSTFLILFHVAFYLKTFTGTR